MAALATLVFPLAAQDYGLDSRSAVGPFLNGALPAQEQSASGWQAVPAFPNLTFDNPVYLVGEPGTNRLYVCEREGAIYFFENNAATTNKTLFLDLTATTQVFEDSGVLGLVFHPQFGVPGSTNRGHVYVYYQFSPAPINATSDSTPGYNRLSRFTVPDGSLIADPNSELVLINQFDRNTWHNGGSLLFGPDGFLYLTMGDEGAYNDILNNAQKIDLGLFAGVLRIDVDSDPARSHPIRRQPQSPGTPPGGWPATYSQHYTIPDENPWLDPGGSILEEFYAIGLRSPHRMSYDPPTGRFWLGDVGQADMEEVDWIEKGGNYQWSYREGTLTGFKPKPNPLIGTDQLPVFEYPHAGGDNCVIGGHVYRGVEHALYLSGKYIFGDNGSSRVWAINSDGSSTDATLLCTLPGTAYTGLGSFGVDQNGEIYMCKMGQNQTLYKLAPTGSQGSPPPALLSQTGAFTNLLSLAPNSGLVPFTVNTPLWSDAAVKSRWMAVPNNGAPYAANEKISFSPTGFWSFPTGTVFVKHFELPINETNASLRKRLETRFLVRGTNGSYYGATYKWREDNSDADLLPGSLNETNLITTATGVRTQVWYYPSREDCIVCHNPNSGQVLGARTCQLNGDFTYPSTTTDNQLRTLNHLELFNPALNETNIPAYPRSAAITDTNATLAHRVRSYLDANCAQCHRPNGVRAFFDARLDTPLENQSLIGGRLHNTLGITGAKVVVPQSPALSMLHVRDNLVGPNQMPPLAKNQVDQEYINVLAQWINSLPPVTPPPPPWQHQDVGPVGVAGDATYSAGTFTVIASGVDIWDTTDSFHFVYRPLVGDAVITARVDSMDDLDEWTIGGVMIRQDLTGGSKHVTMAMTTQHGTSFVRRRTANAISFYDGGSNVPVPYWVRLQRAGNTFTASESDDGINWTVVGSDSVTMTGTVYAGLAWSAHDNSNLGTAAFSNVLLTGSNVNNYPDISFIPAQTINEDSAAGPLAFTVGDLETPAANLSLSVTSSVPALVPATNIVFSGSGSNRFVTLTPLPNQSGTSQVTVAVSDGTNTANAGFQLTVLPVSDPPIAGADALTRWMSQGVQTSVANLLTNDSDADGDTVNLSSVAPVGDAGGTITVSSNWVRYWPLFGSTNADSFTYIVADGNGGSATGLVSVAVTPDPPGTDVLGITRNGGDFAISLTGIPDFTYTLQYSDQLSPPLWQSLEVNSADGAGQLQFGDPPSTNLTRFYRSVRGIAP